MNVRIQKLCSRLSDAVRNHRDSAATTFEQPQEGEVWRTRDGAHAVLIMTRDTTREEHQYPIQGAVLTPEGGGNFFTHQRVTYPRFTLKGGFVNGREHDLDLVKRIR